MTCHDNPKVLNHRPFASRPARHPYSAHLSQTQGVRQPEWPDFWVHAALYQFDLGGLKYFVSDPHNNTLPNLLPALS